MIRNPFGYLYRDQSDRRVLFVHWPLIANTAKGRAKAEAIAATIGYPLIDLNTLIPGKLCPKPKPKPAKTPAPPSSGCKR